MRPRHKPTPNQKRATIPAQKLPGVSMYAARALQSRGLDVPREPGAGICYLGRFLWHAPMTTDRTTGEPRGPRWILARDRKPYEVFKSDPRAAVQP